MWTDAIDLRDFYASALGGVARRMIARRVRQMWPDVAGLSVLGLGYATPFLGPFCGEADSVLAVMPAAQGVIPWPADGASQTALVDENSLPFADRSIDRALLVHALECSEHVRPMMREIWRVLSDSGRMIAVVPNLHGLWAQSERTPFGHGRPYSTHQLSRGLRHVMFTPLQASAALFVPPSRSRVLLSSAVVWEEVGERWFKTFAGVVVFEATKQIYGGQPAVEGAVRQSYVAIALR